VARAQRFKVPLSLVMFDVDHFKMLNDASGHAAGDETLKGWPRYSIRRCARSTWWRAMAGRSSRCSCRRSAQRGYEVAEKLRKVIESYAFRYGSSQPGGRITVSAGGELSGGRLDAGGGARLGGRGALRLEARRPQQVDPLCARHGDSPGPRAGPQAEKRLRETTSIDRPAPKVG